MKMAIQFIGLFLGVFARTWLPYIRKLRQGKIEGFNKKFLKFALGSLILSVITVLLVIPQYEIKDTEIIDFWTGLKVFATAFAFGFGWNTLINESAKWNKAISED